MSPNCLTKLFGAKLPNNRLNLKSNIKVGSHAYSVAGLTFGPSVMVGFKKPSGYT
jgi:hypothetical protein